MANRPCGKRQQVRLHNPEIFFFSVIFINEPKAGHLSELQPHVIPTGLCSCQLGPDFETSFSPTPLVKRRTPASSQGARTPQNHPLRWAMQVGTDGTLLLPSSETTSPF